MSDRTLLTPAEIAALVRASGDAAVAEIRALGDRSKIPRHPASGAPAKCSAISSKPTAAASLVAYVSSRTRIARPSSRGIEPSVAAARRDQERDPEDLVAEFLAGREDGLGFVASLDGATCARVGLHPHVGELSVSDLLHEWVHHDREHLAQMLAVSQSFVWPAMGNARRFSEIDG